MSPWVSLKLIKEGPVLVGIRREAAQAWDRDVGGRGWTGTISPRRRRPAVRVPEGVVVADWGVSTVRYRDRQRMAIAEASGKGISATSISGGVSAVP